jgi:hypothetical protein
MQLFVQIQKYLKYIHYFRKQKHEDSDRCRQKGLWYRQQTVQRETKEVMQCA